MRKTFISYRHNKHKNIIDELRVMNEKYSLFIDKSVDSGDIPDNFDDEKIRRIIRDEKLKDTTITLFIHGLGTDKRKFIDWELAGSMYDYNDSYRNAIIVIDTLDCSMSASDTKSIDVAIDTSNFVKISNEQSKSVEFWKDKLPYAPTRLLKNMARDKVNINVINMNTIRSNPIKLRNLIEKVYIGRKSNDYDTSIPLRRYNG